MKTMLSILLLTGFVILQVTGQEIVDDVYFKPGDVQSTRTTTRPASNIKPNFKNGAKEIVYLDSRLSKDIVLSGDSIFILAEINDSIKSDTLYSESEEEGYYLNGFKGSDTEFEYAERIRRFHNPRYSIHISDPQYTDIYFLDNYNWNVYVDGYYAWVTPTWTNPAWWNYYWTPYSYNSWYWRSNWYSPWGGYYNNWYGYPGYGMGYGWNSFYGGYYPYYGGYWGGGMYGYGYGYPYHHYSWYNPYYPYGGSYYGHSNRKQNYSENVRREYSGFANSASGNTRISGGSQAVSGNSRAASVYSVNGDRNVNNNSRTVYSSARSDGQFETGRTVTTLRNTRTAGAGLVETDVRTRTTNTLRNEGGNISDERIINSTGQRNQNNVQVNRSTVTSSTPTVRNQESSTSRSTTGTVVRSGTGTSPVRSSSVSSTSSSGSSEQSRNNSSTTTRSTYTAPSSSGSSSSSSSSSYSSGSTRSSSPSYSAPSGSGSSSGGGASRSSGGGSSSGGGRR